MFSRNNYCCLHCVSTVLCAIVSTMNKLVELSLWREAYIVMIKWKNKQIQVQMPDINQWGRLNQEGSIWEQTQKFLKACMKNV